LTEIKIEGTSQGFAIEPTQEEELNA